MLERLNTQIVEVKERLREKQRLTNRLNRTQDSLVNEKKRLRELEKSLLKENLDVKKLESLSLTGLFYTVLGNKEQQIEKERQEFLAVKLKYDQCKNSAEAIEEDVNELAIALKKYVNVEEDYNSLMERKKEIILNSEDENAQKLIEMSEKMSEFKSDLKELNEAIEAGNQAQGALYNVIDSLNSARSWGTWDMLGGGLISTAIKHSKIDKARDYVNHAQSMLRRFQDELQDVHLSADLNINIGSFNTFADYFLDGLIFDWVVQSKINKSLDGANEMYDHVKEIVKQLEEKTKIVEGELTAIKQKIRLLVESVK